MLFRSTSIYDGKKCVGQQANSSENSSIAPAVGTTGTYTVAAVNGGPAFQEPVAEGEPLHVFPNGTVLNVIQTTAEGRWLKVLLPDGRAGYVPSVNVNGP